MAKGQRMPKAIQNLLELNYTDYWTKHHPTKHHQNMRNEFITPQIVLEILRQEIPLAKGQREPKAIQNILETREVKLRR